jgi:hypothetical protein
MSELARRLEELAAQTGRPAEAMLRQHALDGLLRRVATSAQAGSLVLRGGLLTQHWVGPALRTTQDADFLALFPCDADEAERRLREALAPSVADGASFPPDTLVVQVIWQETASPGVRVFLQAEALGQFFNLQIDLGFGDPLVPPAAPVSYRPLLSDPFPVLACRPETLVGWKLHGLFEHGLKRWRAKDLYDLLLLTDHVPLSEPDLAEAIRVAFASRAEPLENLREVVESPAWRMSEKNELKWAKFCAAPPGGQAPPPLQAAVERVALALRPALRRLIELGAGAVRE